MNNLFETQMSALVTQISKNIVEQLSKEYNFPIEEAIKLLNLPKILTKKNEDQKHTKKSSIPLPFCGKIISNCCQGIRLNHGLYTQCNNEICSYEYEFPVCKTCLKQCENSQNNKPTYGFIQERIDKGEDFVDCKGKKPICYANIMEKLQISIQQARTAATEAGLEIPESQFILEKKTRGRPRKNIAVPDTPSECDSEEPVKRGRGRPKKDKKIINQDNCDLIVEKLKNTVQINDIKENKNIEQSSSDVEDDSEEETSVECVKIVGKKLIIIQQNDDGSIPKETQYLYNSSTKQLFTPSLEDYKIIGFWNGYEIVKNNICYDSD